MFADVCLYVHAVGRIEPNYVSLSVLAAVLCGVSYRCHLCLTEKLYLIKAKKPSLLSKRSELITKCCHENKSYLANFTSREQ